VNLKVETNEVTFWLRVKPRSSRERLRLDSAGELNLELHAAPTEGQANAACVEFFARLLRLPRSSIEIVAGEKSRRKLIRILGGGEISKQLIASVGGRHERDTPLAPDAVPRKHPTTDN
jgi:uncharacterized protein (TIGR00251 family)